MKSKICIILPAYNEARMIPSVLKNLLVFIKQFKAYEFTVVVVDDGSVDNTFQVASKFPVVVLRHVINRGLGGALSTGIAYARDNNFNYALTMDSDGQHDIHDIPKAITLLANDKADVIVGSRMLGQKGMPWDRVIINSLSNIFTWLMFGVWTSDSQSGFRAFNLKAMQSLNLMTQGMEVSSEIFAEIAKHKLRFAEIPIAVIYSDYSRTKGQSNLNSINVAIKLFLRKFR